MHILIRTVLALLLGAGMGAAQAHKASDAYLQYLGTAQGVELRVDVALRDLDVALDLDSDADGRLTWGEIRHAWPAIDALVLAGVHLDGCDLRVAGRSLERRNDGAYAALQLASTCRAAEQPVLRYTLLRDIDPTHRGLLRIEQPGREPLLRVLDPAQAEPAPGSGAAVAAEPARSQGFVAEGIHHIVTGYDHVLFLLCLLLPAVMRRRADGRGWQPVDRLGQAVLPVAGIVTAFTVAHSITLGLAAAKWVSLPSRLIEPAIALTIVLAAIDNLRSIFGGRRVLITFLFGLIHGFGFAGVLAELNLPVGAFAWALLQFNLGIEIGQLSIVLAAIGALFLVRAWRGYPVWAIRAGSLAAITVGMLWFVQRTADVNLLPF